MQPGNGASRRGERAADGDLPLSIAFLAYRGKPHVGGQGVYTRHLTKALTDLGHHVEVLGGQPYPILDERVPLVELPSLDIYNDHFPMRMPGIWELKTLGDFVEVTAFSMGTFPEPLAFSIRAFQHLRKRVNDFDLVQDNQCLGYGLLGIERLGLPVLATIHHPITVDRRLEMEHAETAWQRFAKARWYAFTKMQTRVASRMTRVLTVSQNSNNDIHTDHKVPLERMHVVPVGVDQDLFRPLPDVRRVPGRLITTASADVTMKGLRYLLEALAKLRTERHVELVVIGRLKEGGPSARTIDELGLRDAVTFVTGVPEERIIELYSEAELAVVPSLYEGFSLPAIEAMSCGVPLVATTGGALPEVVGGDGDTALLVPPGDSDALAARIREALDNPELRAAVGARGRQRVIDRWTWRHTAIGTVEQYRALLAETAHIQARRPGGAASAPRYRRARAGRPGSER
ncbi:glycosyltransferase family 4 protein [Rhabdothermincola sediminis]|uniref:glycosyltransferase family 4 protein n=1 Tax=Rhabdothermincola sediminis TaxID=2751370 RepID=UPI001AA06015|nr:glycosyltransferase family 4 protein [Rhabdothermincola sediminis]